MVIAILLPEEFVSNTAQNECQTNYMTLQAIFDEIGPL
jgi:hypothetical protein